jgi:uncharacterized flavoprotein (TIGR03862 family)
MIPAGQGTMDRRIAVIGGGPAGLMAAEMLSAAGQAVTVFDAKPTVARKFLMAGKSGLNIANVEDDAALRGRYGDAAGRLATALDGFDAPDIRDWMAGLGIDSFVGTSGRIFPSGMKASPLLRAWLARLVGQGVTIATRHDWQGFDGDTLVFATPEGRQVLRFERVVLALGGASWPRLGSDARWVPWLRERGVDMAPFVPANCGFVADWSALFAERFAGEPLKPIRADGVVGECVVTALGLEGGVIYTLSSGLRDAIAATGQAVLSLDLVPGRSEAALAAALAKQKRKESFGNRLRKGAGLSPVKAGLVREVVPDVSSLDPAALAAVLKRLPVPLMATAPIDKAISTAGGVRWSGIGTDYQLKALPGVFVAGEMIDWEAPTGGYLLTACLATGRAAARGVLESLA